MYMNENEVDDFVVPFEASFSDLLYELKIFLPNEERDEGNGIAPVHSWDEFVEAGYGADDILYEDSLRAITGPVHIFFEKHGVYNDGGADVAFSKEELDGLASRIWDNLMEVLEDCPDADRVEAFKEREKEVKEFVPFIFGEYGMLAQ